MHPGFTVTQTLRAMLAWAFLVLVAPATAESIGCSPVRIAEFGGLARRIDQPPRRPEIQLKEPGMYCLEGDVHQRKLMDRGNGREMTTLGGDAIILIGADDVQLDLRNHVVSNDRSLGYTLIRHYRYEPGQRHVHWFVRTHVSNGRLQSPGSKGVGLRLLAAGHYGPAGVGSMADFALGKKAADQFIDTGHLIEGLEIEAGSRGIVIDGSNNIIRNNRIIVDGNTAIIAQGPGIVIEGNVIEVRNDLRRFSDHDRAMEARTPFPIRLVQADGAIIRNNQIRLVDRTAGASLPAAIGLVHSRDVLVQQNRFGGMARAVQADPESSFRETGNDSEACPSGATRYLAPDQAGGSLQLSPPACR